MECLVGNIPVYFETYGSGTPLLAIHGFTPDHRLMTGCLEPLFVNRPGWQRIYLDLPGMGRTPGAEHIKNSDDMLTVVLEFIDAIIAERRFLLAGESYGGYLSQGVLTRKLEHVAGLALICPVVIAEDARRNRPAHTTLVANPELMATLAPEDAEEFGSIAVVQDTDTWRRFRGEILPGLRAADQTSLQKVRQNYALSFEVELLAQRFSGPVVIFAGRQDAVVGYRDAWGILENFPRGTFVVLDRAGHNGHIEQSQLFNALMGEWLARVQESL